MFDPNAVEGARHVTTLTRDGPDVPAFLRRHRPLVILVAVVTAQVLLLSFQITRNHNVRLIRYWAVEVFDPFERGLRGLVDVTGNAYATYRHLWRAEQENRQLSLELEAAQARIQQLGEQANEAQRLRRLLDFKTRLPYVAVAAEVIASSPEENSNAVIIDRGIDAGVRPDSAVITPEGVVGKILAIFPRSAQVLLLTDPASGVAVSLAQSRTQGILKGSGNGLCQLRYVMNEEVVTPGEAVVTSGLDQVYPKGLPVGTVAKAGDGMIYKSIMVKPAVDLSRLEAVLVVLNPSPSPQQALSIPLRP